jgi:hypothetical protein
MADRRRLRACGPRRALLWGLGFFVLFQAALSLILERWWTSARDPYFGPKIARLRERLRLCPGARLAVMLGSSRTEGGLRAVPFEETWGRELGRPLVAFNLGIPGGGPHSQLLQFQRLLREGIAPDVLLVEVLPALLDDRHLGAPHARVAERLSWSDLQEVCRQPLRASPLRAGWCEARAVPCYAHRFSILSMVLPTVLPIQLRLDGLVHCDGCGWVCQSRFPCSAEQRRQAAERAVAEYRPTLESFRLGDNACAALRLLLDECRQRHVPRALVLMPEGPFFRAAYPEEVWRQIDPFLERLSRDHGAPLIDARCWLGEESFLDSHHLSADGAARFTERLGREAIMPLLQRTPPPNPLPEAERGLGGVLPPPTASPSDPGCG